MYVSLVSEENIKLDSSLEIYQDNSTKEDYSLICYFQSVEENKKGDYLIDIYTGKIR